jgi:O-antigen/teichoic acid export membrane protein
MSREVHRSALGRTLVRNTAWNYAGLGVNLLANLVVFPVVVRQLGDVAAGIWLLLGSVTGYMGLLRLGVVPALSRFVATQLAEGDLDAVNRRASTAMALVLAGGSLALAAMPLSAWLADVLNVPPEMQSTATAAIALGLAGFFLQIPGHIFNALLNGAERQDLCGQVWILSTGLKAVLTLAILGAGYGLIALLWVDLLLIVAMGVLLHVMARRAIPSLRFDPALVRRREARELVSFGGLIMATQSARLAIEQSDRLVIGAFLTVSMVTYYSAGWKLVVLAYAVPSTLLSAIGPSAGALIGRGDHAAVRELFLRGTKYGAAVAWPMVISIGACAAVVLELWAGPGFGAHAAVVHVLLATLAVTGHNHAASAIVMAKRDIAPLVWQYELPQAVLNLALSLWLIQHFGIVGVAIGTALPAVALEYFFLRHVLAVVGVSWQQFWHEAVLPALAPTLTFIPLMAAYWQLGPDALVLLPIAGCCSAMYAAAFWHRSLGVGERRQLRQYLRWRAPQVVGGA